MTLPAHPFFIAVQFLTTLPIRLKSAPMGPSMGHSLLYYPLVGGGIGALLSIVLWGFSQATHAPSAPLVAALLLALWIGLTGGLHIDGLADSTDALAGGFGDRAKTLDIMKDPTSGPMAILAVILVLLIKYAALQQLVGSAHWQAVLIAPIIGRGAVISLFLTTPYVRPHGLGAMISQHLPRTTSGVVMVATLLVIWGLVGMRTLWLVLLITVLTVFLLRRLMMQRIGGTTGDTAGAMIELVEAGVLVILALTALGR